MATTSMSRRWTIASWRLGEWATERARFIDQLGEIEPDAVALQRLTARAARAISDALDLPHLWVRSHSPRSRVVPRASVGLAVLTPHRITGSVTEVVSDETAAWSPRRRIAQTVSMRRTDRSAFAISHRSDSGSGSVPELPVSTPVVSINPWPAVGDDVPRIVLPAGATSMGHDVITPVEGAPPLVVTRFELGWVRDGSAAS